MCFPSMLSVQMSGSVNFGCAVGMQAFKRLLWQVEIGNVFLFRLWLGRRV